MFSKASGDWVCSWKILPKEMISSQVSFVSISSPAMAHQFHRIYRRGCFLVDIWFQPSVSACGNLHWLYRIFTSIGTSQTTLVEIISTWSTSLSESTQVSQATTLDSSIILMSLIARQEVSMLRHRQSTSLLRLDYTSSASQLGGQNWDICK